MTERAECDWKPTGRTVPAFAADVVPCIRSAALRHRKAVPLRQAPRRDNL